MDADDALDFVRRYGVVLESAHGSVPNLAEAIAGEPIRGSWWGHPKGRLIFRITQSLAENPEVLVCKLVDGKITYVHRRLWPALIKLASRFPKRTLAQVRNEHTPSGAHVSRTTPFPAWVPQVVLKEGNTLSVEEAEKALAMIGTGWISLQKRR